MKAGEETVERKGKKTKRAHSSKSTAEIEGGFIYILNRIEYWGGNLRGCLGAAWRHRKGIGL